MLITVNYLPDDAVCNTHMGLDNGRPVGVTVHWTGPYPGQSPNDVRDWWIKSEGFASAHYIIKDKECIQCWPDDQAAWHCGDRTGNFKTIGIEVIPENIDGKFSDESIKTLRNLIQERFKGLPVYRHYDWSGKDCPKYYIDQARWSKLLEEIL